jgi:hypothetical protein
MRASNGRAYETRLQSNDAKLWSLSEMEQSGGEPDVVDFDSATGEFVFVDCSAQSPDGGEKPLLRSQSTRRAEGAQAEETARLIWRLHGRGTSYRDRIPTAAGAR